jgi:DNA helicase-2/ATP-dependent DNA helicase PcrA
MLPDYFSFDFKEVFRKYHEKMAENNALDFNDLLIKTVELLRKSPHALSEMQHMWKYFMVDEYQDTNYSQYLIAKYLASASRNICVVGDDDQSIYSWRGADIRNILNFEKDYENARSITLDENYRSTKQILEAASVVIRNNQNRKEKNVRASRGDGEHVVWCSTNNEYGEGEFVINTIQSLKSKEGMKNRDFAIFYRTNAQSRIFEDFLRRENIPYRIVGGLKFYDRKEVKDVLAYMKFLVNRNDSVSLYRIINVPARGIGKTSQEKLMETASSGGFSEWKVIEDELMTGKVPKGIDEFRKIIKNLSAEMERVPAEISLSAFVKLVIDRSGYRESLLEENSLESRSRLDNIDELFNSIIEYEQHDPQATPEQFIQDISLYTSEENPVDDEEDRTNCVTLMTVHNAKGLEFPAVFLTGMEEDTFPHKLCIDTDEAVEEERRLCYVGITRAMDRIFLTSADLRRSYMGPEYKRPSRFIEEIPAKLLEIKNYSSQYYGSSDSGAQRQPWQNRPAPVQVSVRKEVPRTVQVEDESQDLHETEQDSGSKFSLREKVMHPKFGMGRVVKIEGSGDNLKLTISFGLTNRVFLEKYTPLSKIN